MFARRCRSEGPHAKGIRPAVGFVPDQETGLSPRRLVALHDRIVVADKTGPITAVSGAGKILWQTEPFAKLRGDEPPHIRSAHALPGDQVFCTLVNEDGDWAAWLDGKTGKTVIGPQKLPEADLSDAVIQPLDGGRQGFAVLDNTRLGVVDPTFSQFLWTRRVAGLGHIDDDDLPCFINGVLYVVTQEELLAVDVGTGGRIALAPLDLELAAPPMQVGDGLVVLTPEQQLVALRAAAPPAPGG